MHDGMWMSDTLAMTTGKGFSDSTRLVGHLRIWLNGQLVRDIHNTITTAAKAGAADQVLASPTLAKPTHMAVGTSTPAANALGIELDRNILTSKTRSTNVVTMVGDWLAGDGTGAITEAGTFDDPTVGNMWMSSSFSVINKGASDTLSISWTLTFN